MILILLLLGPVILMRALADYFAMRVEYGATIYTGGDWAEVKSYGTKADEVVPWSYGR